MSGNPARRGSGWLVFVGELIAFLSSRLPEDADEDDTEERGQEREPLIEINLLGCDVPDVMNEEEDEKDRQSADFFEQRMIPELTEQSSHGSLLV